MTQGFDVTKERIGSVHNRYIVVPFGGRTTRFRGPLVVTIYQQCHSAVKLSVRGHVWIGTDGCRSSIDWGRRCSWVFGYYKSHRQGKKARGATVDSSFGFGLVGNGEFVTGAQQWKKKLEEFLLQVFDDICGYSTEARAAKFTGFDSLVGAEVLENQRDIQDLSRSLTHTRDMNESWKFRQEATERLTLMYTFSAAFSSSLRIFPLEDSLRNKYLDAILAAMDHNLTYKPAQDLGLETCFLSNQSIESMMTVTDGTGTVDREEEIYGFLGFTKSRWLADLRIYHSTGLASELAPVLKVLKEGGGEDGYLCSMLRASSRDDFKFDGFEGGEATSDRAPRAKHAKHAKLKQLGKNGDKEKRPNVAGVAAVPSEASPFAMDLTPSLAAGSVLSLG
ncbi:hypothetical protein M5K25_006894 [Dendrobium thyrsiflorum]|uniref:Uncharacterized protein n=1 Tax=Dendrobium thyrsiflorum TaxID=117978 RepID=A0ABD0VCU0_DENTH